MTNTTKIPDAISGKINSSINAAQALERLWTQEGVIESQRDYIKELEAQLDSLREDFYDLRMKLDEADRILNSEQYEEEYADQGGLINPF